MARAAVVANGVVTNIIEINPNAAPQIDGLVIPPDGANFAIGWSYSQAKGFTAPPVPLPDASQLRAYAAAKRFALEAGGITLNGATIYTDRDSQGMISGAYTYLQASGSASVSFKAATGWMTLTADQVKSIALAVGSHVQACFAAERTIDDEIEAGVITSYAAVDAAAWPDNGA